MTCAAPDCGTSFEPRRTDHRFCSPKCRLVWFQQKPERARRERDAKVRLLLRTAIEAATEAKELLNPEEDPSRSKSASTIGLRSTIRRECDQQHGVKEQGAVIFVRRGG
jgi:hypothetical protein